MRKNDMSALSISDVAVALVLLTRLPLPALSGAALARQAQAVWSFPLVGLAVTVPALCVGGLAHWLGLPLSAVAGVILMVQIVLTGAMHEDGLADYADGFWGGFDPARRLEIMKDSQIGTYGVLALILTVALRWSALVAILTFANPAAIVAVAVASRAPMAVLMARLPNARGSGLSQSVGAPPMTAVWLGCGLAACIGLALTGVMTTVLLLAGLIVVTVGMTLLARAKIGGQTGDVLGATQQISETTCLLLLAAAVS